MTNTFADRTADALHARSENLPPGTPTRRSVAAGIAEAVRRSEGVAARAVCAAGAAVAWSRDGRTSFDDDRVGRIADALRDG